jgi:hypothetical protein
MTFFAPVFDLILLAVPTFPRIYQVIRRILSARVAGFSAVDRVKASTLERVYICSTYKESTNALHPLPAHEITHVRHTILTWHRGFQPNFYIWSCFLCIKSFVWINRQRNLKKIVIMGREPRSHVRILIYYRTWAITNNCFSYRSQLVTQVTHYLTAVRIWKKSMGDFARKRRGI